MDHRARTPAWIAGPALILGLLPALSARADTAPPATFLHLPAQGVVSSSACESVPLAGEIVVFTQAFPHNPGSPLTAQIALAGALAGQSASGTQYVAVAGPLEVSLLFYPGNPCAPIAFPVSIFAISPSASLPSPDFPHNPGCPTQASTGTLILTFNADGTVQAATVSIGGVT